MPISNPQTTKKGPNEKHQNINPDNFIGEKDAHIKPDERALEEKKSYIADSKRKRREQNAVHWSYVCLIWLGVVAVSAVLIIRISHLILPPQYIWLDDAHVKKLDEFLTSGAIGGVIVGAFKNKFGKND